MPTALSLLALYGGGLALYALWAVGAAAEGASPALLVALGAVLCIALPFALATVSFALAWIFRTPRPPEKTIGAAAALRLFVGEAIAMAKSHARMALAWWAMRDPPARRAAAPVLLVHGVLCNAGIWRGTLARLAAAGTGPLYTVSFAPPHASIEVFAEQLAAKIDGILAATGARRVALVAHSMGGLVARAYLRRYGGAKVRCLLAIGTPHHGSVHAWMCPGECLAQIRPGSDWLARINADEGASPPARIVTLWSRHDSMVGPQASSRLGGAEEVDFVGIGHNALIEHPAVVDRLVAELERAAREAEEEAAGTDSAVVRS